MKLYHYISPGGLYMKTLLFGLAAGILFWAVSTLCGLFTFGLM